MSNLHFQIWIFSKLTKFFSVTVKVHSQISSKTETEDNFRKWITMKHNAMGFKEISDTKSYHVQNSKQPE